MARQVTGQYGYLAWKYGTAAGASEYETYNNASYVNRTELDPLGGECAFGIHAAAGSAE